MFSGLIVSSSLDLLPPGVACSKETRDTIIECCVGAHCFHRLAPLFRFTDTQFLCNTEFIHLIASEANGICEEEAKKTISPEHIIAALRVRMRPLSLLYDSIHPNTLGTLET
jgi:hypothetical protein